MSKHYVLEVCYQAKGDTAAKISFNSEPLVFPSNPTQEDFEEEARRLLSSQAVGETEILCVKGREVGV